jgi:hypothetical protein
MDNRTNHTSSDQSSDRTEQLEKEIKRLRFMLQCREQQIADLTPGLYILTDEGDFNGPCPTMLDVEKAIPDYTEDGGACTVVQVVSRHVGAVVEDWDKHNGVHAGDDYPRTMTASVANW